MNILHITKKYPDALGGDAVVVDALVRDQIRAGHAVRVVTSNCPEIRNSDEVIKFGMFDHPEALDRITIRRLLTLSGLVFRAFGLIRRYRPDVIHAHSVDMGFAVSMAARFYRVPLIYTAHCGLFSFSKRDKLRSTIESQLLKLSGFKAITTVNRADVEIMPDQNVRYTPNGVDLKRFVRARNPKRTDIVFAGRIELDKGVLELLEALKRLHDEGRNFRAVFIGEGTYSRELANLVEEYGLKDVVELAGYVSHAEIAAYYQRAQVVALPSRVTEGFGMALAEAMASGSPVIATSVCGIAADISRSQAGLVVAPGDVNELYAALLAINSDHVAASRMSENAAQWAHDYYDSNKTSQNFVEIYKDVLRLR